jgi:prepilin-type N-terminal cleavage/methylation domain-containing protein
MRRESGFTLIELLMVVAILGILASMAILNVWRARSAANEGAAIGTMRTIISGQIAYSATCGAGNFGADFLALGPAPLSPQPFLPPDLTAAASIQKSGFTFAMGPSLTSVAGANDCNGTPTETGYYATAIPSLFGTTGGRSFATDSEADAIWQVFDPAAPSEPFAAPAMPIQ